MTGTKSDRIRQLEHLVDYQGRQIQDLFKDIGALSAWRRSLSTEQGRTRGELMTIREDLDKMRQEVDETKTVTAGAVTAITGVSQLVKDLQARIDTNPGMTAEEISAELGAMASELDANQQSLAAAIANVPTAQGTANPAPTAAERAASEGNATLEQPNAPK